MSEPSLHDQLLTDYDRHEDNVDRAALVELWALGDWLAKYVPNDGRGRPKMSTRPDITLDDLIDRRGRSRSWLHDLRKVAEATEPDRLPKITPRVYIEALRAHKWDLMAANASLVTKGHRLRDQAGKMESPEALHEGLRKRTPQERADFVRRALDEDPTVRELLGNEVDPDSFGEEWVDLFVLRVHTAIENLRSHIEREGLRFAPSTPPGEMLEFLLDAEHKLAEVRAAVQERVNDERAEVAP